MTTERILMVGSFIIIGIVLTYLFVIEYYGGKEVFNETINGMVIGGSFSWIGAYITFYTAHKENANGNGKDNDKTDNTG